MGVSQYDASYSCDDVFHCSKIVQNAAADILQTVICTRKLSLIQVEQTQNYVNDYILKSGENSEEVFKEIYTAAHFIREKLSYLDCICFLLSSFNNPLGKTDKNNSYEYMEKVFQKTAEAFYFEAINKIKNHEQFDIFDPQNIEI